MHCCNDSHFFTFIEAETLSSSSSTIRFTTPRADGRCTIPGRTICNLSFQITWFDFEVLSSTCQTLSGFVNSIVVIRKWAKLEIWYSKRRFKIATSFVIRNELIRNELNWSKAIWPSLEVQKRSVTRHMFDKARGKFTTEWVPTQLDQHQRYPIKFREDGICIVFWASFVSILWNMSPLSLKRIDRSQYSRYVTEWCIHKRTGVVVLEENLWQWTSILLELVSYLYRGKGSLGTSD